MDVSIVIVSYNAKLYLEHCLNSLFEMQSHYEFEVIVVDNASPENVVSYLKPKFPQVNWRESNENIGFAKANNLGVKQAKGEFVLILNPDTFVPENLFHDLIPFSKSKENIGAVGVRLIDGDGNFHPESKRNIPSPKNTFSKLFGFLFGKKVTGYYKNDVSENEIAEVPVLVGAFMLMKKEIYDAVNGFDEGYFMYGEDIDLCYRLEKEGYKNIYFGKKTVVHYKGKSTKIFSKSYLKNFFGAMEIFIRKHYSEKLLSKQILLIGVKFRFFLLKSLGFFSGKPKQYNFNSDKRKVVVLEKSEFSNQELIQQISENESNQFEILIQTNERYIGNHTTIKIEEENLNLN